MHLDRSIKVLLWAGLSEHRRPKLMLQKGCLCITDMRYWPACFGRTKWVIVSRHDRLILPRRVSHQNSGFASYCLLSERDMLFKLYFLNYGICGTYLSFLACSMGVSVKLRVKKLMIIFTITSLPKKMSLKLFGFLRSLNFNFFFNRPEDFMIRELQAAEEEKAKAVRKALNQ